MADLNKLYAEEYDSSKSYSSGDKCVYNGEWYQANDTTTGTFDEDKWNKKYIVDYLSGGSADGTATTDDVLDGKTFGSSSGTGQVGTMPDKSGTSTKATTITSDDTYTYLNIPTSGYYDTSSKLYMENSNLATSTLLWTNSNPAINFSAQTINLNLTNYKNVIVDFCYSTTNVSVGSRVILSKNERPDGFGCGIYENSIAVSRNVKITDISIVFGDGYIGTNKRDNILIPYKIYGIKGNLF